MSQFTVLQLDGRRQVVKVTLHTTILEILDEVCQKIGLSSDNYDLKHHRKILDASSSVQFCGLPQHAQLELVVSNQPRILSEVTLCLQLENGQRLDGKFHPSANLWEIILKTAPGVAESYESPVIIYARREIIGREDLTKTSLRSIGLIGGRVAMRLINKSLQVLRTQANESAPLQRQIPAAPPVDQTDNSCENPAKPAPASIPTTSSAGIKPDEETKAPEIMDVSSDSHQPSKVAESMEVVVVGNTETTDSPDDPDIECKRPRVSSPVVAEEIQFEKVILLGPRHAVAYNLDMIPPTIIEDLPDDFYELNIKDVRSLAAASRRALKEAENAPLLTAQQRQLDQDGITLQKLAQYHSCVVRIRFPDRSVLQGCFKPIETVQDICDFVKEYLNNPSLEFYLYTTPPKTILKKEERLVEANCVPSVNLYLGTSETLSGTYLKPEVADQFSTHSAANQALLESRSKDSAVICKAPLNSTEKMEEAASSSQSSSGGNAEPQRKTNSSVSGNIVPKWLKLSK